MTPAHTTHAVLKDTGIAGTFPANPTRVRVIRHKAVELAIAAGLTLTADMVVRSASVIEAYILDGTVPENPDANRDGS